MWEITENIDVDRVWSTVIYVVSCYVGVSLSMSMYSRMYRHMSLYMYMWINHACAKGYPSMLGKRFPEIPNLFRMIYFDSTCMGCVLCICVCKKAYLNQCWLKSPRSINWSGPHSPQNLCDPGSGGHFFSNICDPGNMENPNFYSTCICDPAHTWTWGPQHSLWSWKSDC